MIRGIIFIGAILMVLVLVPYLENTNFITGSAIKEIENNQENNNEDIQDNLITGNVVDLEDVRVNQIEEETEELEPTNFSENSETQYETDFSKKIVASVDVVG